MKKIIVSFIVIFHILYITSCSSSNYTMQIMTRGKVDWEPARGIKVVERQKISNWYNLINPIAKTYHSKEIRKNLTSDDKGMVPIPKHGGVLQVSMPKRIECLLMIGNQRVHLLPSHASDQDFWFDVYFNHKKLVKHIGFPNANDRFEISYR